MLSTSCIHSTTTVLVDNYRENLYYLELFEGAHISAAIALPGSMQAADIGSSHWFYAHALYNLLRCGHSPAARDVTIIGSEMDAYRVYVDFRSRFDHAQANIREF